MRAQSAIEFLTTYSYVFIIIAVAVGIVLYLANTPTSSLSTQCTAFGGPTCNFVQIFVNQSPTRYTLVSFVLTNSQSVPINISGISVTIRGNTFSGTCTPTLLFPGASASCAAETPSTLPLTAQVQGSYAVNTMFCNSGVFGLSKDTCNYEIISYGGSFTGTPVNRRIMVFTVAASKSPYNSNLLPYLAINSFPVQPNNYTILQNGDWETPVVITNPAAFGTNYGTITYAFANNAQMLASTYYGYKPTPYPAALSSLYNANVACTAPYNSILTIAATTLYMSNTPTTLPIRFASKGAMEMFYRYATLPNQPWNSILFGANWIIQNPSNPPAQFSNTLTLTQNGLYNIESWWTETCGSGGQVLQVNAIPN